MPVKYIHTLYNNVMEGSHVLLYSLHGVATILHGLYSSLSFSPSLPATAGLRPLD